MFNNNFDEGNPPPIVQGVGGYPPPIVTSGQHQQQYNQSQKNNNKGGGNNNGQQPAYPPPQQTQPNRDTNSVFQHVFQTYAIGGQPYWLPSTIYSFGNGNPVNAFVQPIDQSRIAGYCVRWPDGSFHIIRPDHPLYAQIEKDSTDLSGWIDRATQALKEQKEQAKKKTGKSNGSVTGRAETLVLTRMPLWAILWFITLTAAVILLFAK